MPLPELRARVAADPALSATPDPTRTPAYAAAYARFLQHLDQRRELDCARRRLLVARGLLISCAVNVEAIGLLRIEAG